MSLGLLRPMRIRHPRPPRSKDAPDLAHDRLHRRCRYLHSPRRFLPLPRHLRRSLTDSPSCPSDPPPPPLHPTPLSPLRTQMPMPIRRPSRTRPGKIHLLSFQVLTSLLLPLLRSPSRANTKRDEVMSSTALGGQVGSGSLMRQSNPPRVYRVKSSARVEMVDLGRTQLEDYSQ